MSDKPGGFGEGFCDACGRRRSWGCGHSGTHERDARRHRLTAKHRAGKCDCFDHSACDPTDCANAGRPRPGYAPYYTHQQIAAGEFVIDADGHIQKGQVTA